MSRDPATVAVKPASTVCALRAAPDGMDVLMVRRAVASEFMGGAYVFPGGSVDAADQTVGEHALRGDDPEQRPWHAAALRELAEEAGVLVTAPPPTAELIAAVAGTEGAALFAAVAAAGFRFDATGLAYLSNWVTPLGPPRRFDTRFFVVEVPPGTDIRADLSEVTDARWVRPADALARAEAGEWDLPFPTQATLGTLARFTTPQAAVAWTRNQEHVERVAPRVVREGDSYRVLMPGDPGYDEAPA